MPDEGTDQVVEAYKRDVGRTLLRENLRKTVDQRPRDMEAVRPYLRGAPRPRPRRAHA